jgi:Holliday junction resolvase
MKFFNTAGPVNQEEHYKLDPLKRFDIEDIQHLIAQKKYFILHAPRQTGKTSSMLALTDYLNNGDDYKAIYCNIEGAQAARNNIKSGIETIIGQIAYSMEQNLNDDTLLKTRNQIISENNENDALNVALSQIAGISDKPVVMIFDEIDSLIGDTLISVLRQLRAGYTKRPQNFPISIILCGVRDVRDYRMHSKDKEVVTGGSAFNIKAESLKLGSFSLAEVETLYLQHTKETGQKFEAGVFDSVYELTSGQPWLVNALAYEVCFRIKENRNREILISKEHIEIAKENLILRRETHLDQLVDKLKEERVRKIVEPILMSRENISQEYSLDDEEYVIDLGLIAKSESGSLSISNKIYEEVIPRTLSSGWQGRFGMDRLWYINPDKSLNMDKLLTSFQSFFREHSESWIQLGDYKEAGPQLLLQAYLQRVVNSGGHIHREYALGRKRVDLVVNYEGEKFLIEMKILYKNIEKQIEEGLRQTAEYADMAGSEKNYLLIFNRKEAVSWEEKIFKKQEKYNHTDITVYGM